MVVTEDVEVMDRQIKEEDNEESTFISKVLEEKSKTAQQVLKLTRKLLFVNQELFIFVSLLIITSANRKIRNLSLL